MVAITIYCDNHETDFCAMAPAPPMDKEGYWGEPTSTLDWCEENYVVTPYIAEFWNTISNAVMIVPALAGAVYSWRIGLEPRFIVLNLALFVVGIGSWLFHMTLKYEMQLLDELPMIYGTAALIYTLHNCASGLKEASLVGAAVPVSYCVTVSIAYITMRKPILHQAFYGALVFLLIYKSIEACKREPKIVPYVVTSFSLYLIGFILWNFENHFCSTVR